MAARPPIASALLAASAGLLVFGACTVLYPFNLEGLPCGAGDECADGYLCIDATCQSADAGSICPPCGAGFRCDTVTRGCVPDSCDTRRCPVSTACVQTDGGHASCQPVIAPALGHACATDDDCSSNQLCFKGAVTNANGFIRTGTCQEPCTGSSSCTASGATCRAFPLALDAGAVSLCVTPNLLTPCDSDQPCAASGLTCTLFDHPSTGPISVCDAPLANGGGYQAACISGSDGRDAGVLCGNGLCIPRVTTAAPPTCSELCNAGTCPGSSVCQLVEFGVEQGFPVRQVPMCIAAPTVCQSCATSSTVCGPDAPRCTFYGAGPVCLSACTPGDGGATPECPPDSTCQQLAAGPRCVPNAGCP